MIEDPVEKVIASALTEKNIAFVHECERVWPTA